MNNTIALTLIAAAHVLTAAAGDRMALWPEGRIPDFQSHQVGAMENETKAKGLARLAVPASGYAKIAWNR